MELPIQAVQPSQKSSPHPMDVTPFLQQTSEQFCYYPNQSFADVIPTPTMELLILHRPLPKP